MNGILLIISAFCLIGSIAVLALSARLARREYGAAAAARRQAEGAYRQAVQVLRAAEIKDWRALEVALSLAEQKED